jgi:hypothetical protein
VVSRARGVMIEFAHRSAEYGDRNG